MRQSTGLELGETEWEGGTGRSGDCGGGCQEVSLVTHLTHWIKK